VRLDDRRFGSFSIRLDFGTPRHRSPTSRRQPRLARNPKRLHVGLEPAAIWWMSAGRVIVGLKIRRSKLRKAEFS